MAAPAFAQKQAAVPATATSSAAAAGGLAIAAVVGEEAISSYDVEARLRFLVATTRLTNSAETLARVRPQVVRSLVDERLQLKEATKAGITVSDAEVTSAIAGIESQRGMSAGAIAQMLTQNNVPEATFENQIRAQLAWSKLVGQKIRPRIKISDEEALAKQKTITIPKVNQQLEIAFLTLPVDRPKREAEVRGVAAKLASEMRSGASFEELARQLSGRSAKMDRFWVKPEQLDPAIGKVLATAKLGTITQPIRTEAGYSIVKVYNTRSAQETAEKDQQIRIKDILLKLKADAENHEASTLLSIAEELAKNPGNCEEKGFAGIENLQDAEMLVTMREMLFSELSPALKLIAANLKIGETSPPFATDQGIQLYMLCGRSDVVPAAEIVDLNQVKTLLLAERLELEAQKLMRNLRRDTFIEIR
jgi:peptidyl-prolyl cis-trans isomerase SurA